MGIEKGAAQGSLIGPFAFNTFQNDLLFLLNDVCNIYNVADDNTISCYGNNVQDVCADLKRAINVLMHWFQSNNVQAD